MYQEEGAPCRQAEGPNSPRGTIAKNSTTHARAHRFLRDTLIVTTTVTIACAALVGAGVLADSLPATVTAVAGFLGFCAVAIVAALRETRPR